MIGEAMNIEQTPFCRAIELKGTNGAYSAELEDNFHHFRVVVRHDGAHVTDIVGQAVRHPWSLCPFATAELTCMVGTSLSPDPVELAGRFSIRQHCTHLFDLAMLAITGAARDLRFRRYDIVAPQPQGNRSEAHLTRDDGLTITMVSVDAIVTVPHSWSGVSVKKGFSEWAAANLPADERDMALILRRSLFLGRGRRDLDSRRTAGDNPRNMGGCFVMQPERAAQALRVRGSTWDFPKDGKGPLDRA
jgi:hypothetical protein